MPSETSTLVSSPRSTPAEVPAKTPETTKPPLTSPPRERKSPPNIQPGASTKDEPPKSGKTGTSPQSRAYTWQDAGRTMTVLIQDDLTVGENGKLATHTPSQSNEQNGLGARDSTGSADANEEPALPVFRSRSGSIMTLPGGVLLALDETWTTDEASAFLTRNSIEQSRISELEYLTNGFFINTEPGFPSLELANSLVLQRRVILQGNSWADFEAGNERVRVSHDERSVAEEEDLSVFSHNASL